MKNIPSPIHHYQQKGAVLIMGLVLLMALTIVGVASLSNNTLQSRMAGNLMDSNLAFNAAETAARAVQATLNPDFDSQDNCAGSTYDGVSNVTCAIDEGDASNARADMDWMKNKTDTWWKTADSVHNFTGDYNAKIGGHDLITSSPKAIVELYASGGGSYESRLSRRTLTTGKKFYRVTVRATGASDNSQAVIQQIINKHR